MLVSWRDFWVRLLDYESFLNLNWTWTWIELELEIEFDLNLIFFNSILDMVSGRTVFRFLWTRFLTSTFGLRKFFDFELELELELELPLEIQLELNLNFIHFWFIYFFFIFYFLIFLFLIFLIFFWLFFHFFKIFLRESVRLFWT